MITEKSIDVARKMESVKEGMYHIQNWLDTRNFVSDPFDIILFTGQEKNSFEEKLDKLGIFNLAINVKYSSIIST